MLRPPLEKFTLPLQRMAVRITRRDRGFRMIEHQPAIPFAIALALEESRQRVPERIWIEVGGRTVLDQLANEAGTSMQRLPGEATREHQVVARRVGQSLKDALRQRRQRRQILAAAAD